ncbi:hypothetical protein [Aerolutibacter daejeonensis]|uniref:hypothetical protein n=1 Tax=Aerolutibacter daejeonensis TaxID=346181 RepID=UPI0018DC5FC2|nr:hypothetical protein [Lysobacter daejeonensis]
MRRRKPAGGVVVGRCNASAAPIAMPSRVDSVLTLQAGDLFFGEEGVEHSARPRGEARVLVIEREGSP